MQADSWTELHAHNTQELLERVTWDMHDMMHDAETKPGVMFQHVR